MAGANVFVAYISVGDFALIEDVADPADGVSVRPRNPQADARNGGCMMRNGWSRGSADEVQAEFGGDGMQRACESVLSGKNPGACRKVSAAHAERVVGD